MDRRKFLLLSSAISTTPLFASTKNSDDVYVPKYYEHTFYSVYNKLNKIQRIIGYANFNLLGFDDALKIAKIYSTIGAFTKKEIDFIEYLFYSPAENFGFYGDRTVHNLSSKINKKDTIKIRHTGHYVYKGEPLKIYKKMIKDVDNIYLTSGIRSVVKQLKLFLGKIKRTNLNISKASFSIAPPGYSYHSVSDFDVGKRGWGYYNFTSRFATTLEFKEIRSLSYVGIRYIKNNHYGVRFEPWHIKVI